MKDECSWSRHVWRQCSSSHQSVLWSELSGHSSQQLWLTDTHQRILVIERSTSLWIKHLSSFLWWLHHKYKQSVQLKNVILITAHLIHQDYVNKKLDVTKIGLFTLICLLSLGHFVEHELRSVIRLLSRPLNQPAYIDTVNIDGRWLFSTSCHFSCYFYSRLVTITWNCFNYYRQGFIRDN